MADVDTSGALSSGCSAPAGPTLMSTPSADNGVHLTGNLVRIVTSGFPGSRFCRGFQHLCFGTMVAMPELPGPGIVPVEVVSFELFPGEGKCALGEVWRMTTRIPGAGSSRCETAPLSLCPKQINPQLRSRLLRR
jgi:hypothetical protein